MFSKDGRIGRREDAGGCIKQRVVNALWEHDGRFEVGLWHECGAVFEAHMLNCCE